MIYIKFGSITTAFDGSIYWLIKSNGERMQVGEDALEQLLQDYYEANF